MKRLLLITLLSLGCANESALPRLHGEWQSSTLPATPYTHLVFRAYSDAFDVLADERAIYSFRDPAARDRLTVHVVELPRGARKLRVTTEHLGNDAILATQATIPAALIRVHRDSLRQDAADILLGIAFIAAGLMAMLAAALRRRGDVIVLAAMGAFTFLYGARLLVDSYLPLFLGMPVRRQAFVEAFLTYVIPVPGWLVPLRLMQGGWKSSLRWQVIAFAVFAPIGIASDLVTRTPASLELINNVLVIAGGLNIFANLVASKERHTQELRVVLAGSVVFLLFALENNLAGLGLLPWRGDVEAIGFLVFIGALGFAATRAFTKSEKERTALDHELATAREIQLAILPTTMPNVNGLRFRARYDPATSVAGDLYDFLRVGDAQAGVLVADVAGHGVPAALIASMVKIAVSSQSKHDDPAAILTELNATLRNQVRKAFVTATYLWLDMESRRVAVCNAGHAPPLLWRPVSPGAPGSQPGAASREPAGLSPRHPVPSGAPGSQPGASAGEPAELSPRRSGEDEGTFVDLGEHGVLLGRFASVRYTTSFVDLRPGDRITAFTDGIVEARNARGEQFGEERLKALLARNASPDEVIDAVHAWRVEEDADDLTIVTIEVT